ncbi:ATP-binding cassette subfamily C protein LapB [Agrobacterium larrymoorei]|uniref:ATP-binding cassette subfamily C protein LapB n=1 Tax=Agrobacterium larrymoorei TaxID=160699 RepID=A0AAJ2EQ70_9HYPH|nr:ATP-binding cassette subfamily C protein LapB [Agrobacterium larrymoorei]
MTLDQTNLNPQTSSCHLLDVGEPAMAAMDRVGSKTPNPQLVSLALDDITPAMAPCVLLLSNGRGLAVRGVTADGVLETIGKDGPEHFRREAIAHAYVGSIISLSRPSENTSRAEAPPVASGTFDISMKTIFRDVIKSGRVIELFLVAILSNLFIFALPLFSMAIYDRIIPHRAYETLWALTLGLLIVLIIDLTSRLLRNRVHEAIAYKLNVKNQRELFSRILATDLDHAPKSASTISSALSAVEAACQLAPALLVGLLVDMPFVVLLFLHIAFTANWVVVVPIFATSIIVSASVVLHAAARRAYAATVKNNVQQTMLIEESVSGFATTKITTSQSSVFTNWYRMMGTLSKSSMSGRSSTNLSGQIANTVIQLNTVFALVIGVFMIASGYMTVGALVSAVMLSGRALSPIIAFVTGFMRMSSLVESLALARQLASLPPEQPGDPNFSMPSLKGAISLKSVEMRYPEAPAASLRNIDLQIQPGDKVAIIGRIGSGKSSLVKLLPRLHLPSDGNIVLEGHDIRQFSPDFLRKNIAYMPQDCDLFDASIRDNILKGIADVDERAFAEAVKVSGVQEIVATHPAGYDLQVGRGGRRLSGGERQAVCLARALVRNAPILALDEPTSAMDSQMEQAVVARLKPFIAGKTLIVATHRTPLLALVNRVIWLNNGTIVADGTPSDIIAQASRAA